LADYLRKVRWLKGSAAMTAEDAGPSAEPTKEIRAVVERMLQTE
jgi:hypothetical protein